jgi:hypothetical protein
MPKGSSTGASSGPIRGRSDAPSKKVPESFHLGRLIGPNSKYGFLGFLTRAPVAPGAPGGHPGPSLGVSGVSGALPEKPGNHNEQNQKPMSQTTSTEQSFHPHY